MTRSFSTSLPAVLVGVALVTTPALAQQRDHGRDRGDRPSEGRAERQAESRGNRPSEGRAIERAQPRSEAPRAESRADVAPRVAPRVESRRDTVESRRETIVPRHGIDPPRAYAPRYEPRYEPRYAPRYSPRYVPFWESRGYYRPYIFRPRISIGFGLFAGYPVPYTYTYPYAYSVGRPAAWYYGGVVLEIEPDVAAVYVDGAYAGIVRDFDGSRQPLTLTAGTHRIEIEEPGLAPLVFDVTVQPGQVIPYRGDLRPY
jgi:hypothetical protein